MNDALNRYVQAATGFTQVTKDTAEKIVKNLIKQGETATKNPQELVEQLVERSQENREAMTALVRSETKRMVKRMGFATQTDVERLQRQVADLRRKLSAAEEQAAGGGEQGSGASGGSGGSASTTSPAREAARETARARTEERAEGTEASPGGDEPPAKKAATKKRATKKAAKKTAARSGSKTQDGEGGS